MSVQKDVLLFRSVSGKQMYSCVRGNYLLYLQRQAESFDRPATTYKPIAVCKSAAMCPTLSNPPSPKQTCTWISVRSVAITEPRMKMMQTQIWVHTCTEAL